MTFDPNRWGVVQNLVFGRLLAGILVTLLFAILARWIRGVSLSGALVGFVLSLILYVCAGPGAFVVLVSVFILTSAATRLGYGRKEKLGTAEKDNGRAGSQVFANLGVATISAALFALQTNSIYLIASISALAEAAADTVSSEYGQARGRTPRLITTWRIVPSGTDGAVSAAGTLAGILAALIVSVVSVSVKLIPVNRMLVCISAAIFGMLCDSLLGASLERRHWLNNNAVNFLSTLVAAALAVTAILM